MCFVLSQLVGERAHTSVSLYPTLALKQTVMDMLRSDGASHVSKADGQTGPSTSLPALHSAPSLSNPDKKQFSPRMSSWSL